jgi:hypothetical protein
VQKAHLGRIELRGNVSVARGGWLGGLLAAIAGMPAANPECHMRVLGEHVEDRMIWRRSFGGQKLESNFVRDGDDLIETMGPLKLRLRPHAEQGRLRYDLIGAQIGPIRLPRFVMPQLTAWEGEWDGYYEFEVEIRLPLIGRLVRYGGLLTLIPA